MKLRVSVVATVAFLAMTFACPASAAPKKVILAWQAPGATTGIAVTGYKVYRGLTASGEGATAFAVIGNVTTFTDTNVVSGVNYFYKVTATGTCDSTIWDCSTFVAESVPSNETTSGMIPLPTAPTIGGPTAATATVQ